MEKRKTRIVEGIKRKPYQGVLNIIKFNWHYYVLSFCFIVLLFLTRRFIISSFNIIATLVLLFVVLSTIVSLVVSYYIYDYSELYSFKWLEGLDIGKNRNIVNINAGFDETSQLLKQKYPDSNLTVLDFYDPEKHTEISIKRARKSYPAFKGTQVISTNHLPIAHQCIDYIFFIFALHEIRQEEERIDFLKQTGSAIKTDGRVVLVEHQRDMPNFLAFNIGFFHFYSNNTWKNNISRAGLVVESENKITPFVSIFILKKNDSSS
jgi:hypothetical protein